MRRNSPRPPLAFALAIALLLAACAPAARYHVLATLFDGVPAPEGVEPVAQPPARSALSFQTSRPIPKTFVVSAKPKLPPKVYVHAPVRERRCNECHSAGGRMEVGPVDARLCDKCHHDQRVSEGWNHGPINLGTCIPCHVAHSSIYEHLLAKPVPELCLGCHQEDLDRKEPYHQVENVDRCTECHDPHRMY